MDLIETVHTRGLSLSSNPLSERVLVVLNFINGFSIVLVVIRGVQRVDCLLLEVLLRASCRNFQLIWTSIPQTLAANSRCDR